jgi:hypothetical protein
MSRSSVCQAAHVSRLNSSDVEQRPQLVEGELAERLATHGFVLIAQRFSSVEEAWAAALSVARRARDFGDGASECLEVVGEFNLPPDGSEQRDFQALHVDFGFPRLGVDAVDLALYTALYIDANHESSGTATRLAPLRHLLRQRAWPAPTLIAEHLRSGTGDGRAVEGVMARIIECVDQSQDLPPQDDSFLCGMEFSSIDEEERYFRRHGIELQEAEQSVVLGSGDLLLFDNLAIAHGRYGHRAPRELHQLCIGLRAVDRATQAEFLEALADRFPANAAPALRRNDRNLSA